MLASRLSRSRGIATVQLVALGSFLTLVLGVLVPMFCQRIAAQEKARAIGDLRQLAGDIVNYRRDTGCWPDHSTFAYADGTPAVDEQSCFGSESRAQHISNFLAVNEPPVPGWRGPYMSLSRPDPWGHRYVMALKQLDDPAKTCRWILSAGPDGVFQTCGTDRELQGDDLGFVLR